MSRRRRSTGSAGKTPAAGLASVGPTHQLTPPCSSCGYPLLKWDTVCPRCKTPTPWKDTAPPIGS